MTAGARLYVRAGWLLACCRLVLFRADDNKDRPLEGRGQWRLGRGDGVWVEERGAYDGEPGREVCVFG